MLNIIWIQHCWRADICIFGAGYLRFRAPLARTGIKQFNRAALLDFPKVIGPKESNPDGETSHFEVVWT